MVRDLDKVEQGVRAGECEATRPTLRRLDRNIADLPEDVDPELQTGIDRGVDHLKRLVRRQCKQQQADPVFAEPEPIAPPPVESTPEPTPPVTEPPLEAEEQQEPQPEDQEIEEPKEPKELEEPKGEEREGSKGQKGPKGDKPTEEGICGKNPAPTC